MINLESYLIPAIESDSTISSIEAIIKKYPINYPKELNNYKFGDSGNFDENVEKTIKKFFFSADYTSRFNNVLRETLSLVKYKEKIKKYCEKTNYTIDDFKIEIDDVYFRYYRDDIKNNQMYVYISFGDRIDRYEAPRFPQLMLPILSEIVKNDFGSQWIVKNEEYPTEFTIYRPLNSAEVKFLQEIHERNISAKNKEIDEKINKFYRMPIYKQIKTMFDDIIFEDGYYEWDIGVKLNEKRFNLNEGDKIINLKFGCLYVAGITNKDSNYKKLKKIYYSNDEQLRCITVKQYFEKYRF